MKNVQKPEKIHLGKLIEEIKKGRFVIPDFQREFEWEPWDVEDLMRSIFRDYYIGTLLLWEGSKHNYKLLSCTNIEGYSGKSDPEYIVLDGQQRLTAMHFAFFQPQVNYPRRKNQFLFFLRINEFLDENFDEAFYYYSATRYISQLVESEEMQFQTHIFPLGVMCRGSWDISDWIRNYREYWRNKLENYEEWEQPDDKVISKEEIKQFISNAERFKDEIEELLNNYQVSYIALDDDIDVGKVCDIFTQINAKGIHLGIFDLLNAILRPKNVFLKNLWKEAAPRLTFTDSSKMKTYVLQVMSILAQSYCSPKYLYYLVPEAEKTIKTPEGGKEKIVLIDSEEAFIQKWNEAVLAIERTIKAMKNPRDFGAISPQFVPYPSIIPALSAIRRFVETSDLKSKIDIQSKIKKWYWASIFLNRYSSSVESTSTKDFMDLKKWFEDDDAELDCIAEFYGKYKELDLHKEIKKGSAIYNAIFNILVLNEARDWSTFDLPEYDTLDDHHIVPQWWGRENGIWQINSILNRTPLNSDTNRNVIHKSLPNEYLKNMFASNDKEKVFKVLSSHLISRKAVEILLRNPFTKEDFYEFIEERKKTIIEAIENKIIEEKVELPPNLQSINNQIENIELSIRELIANKLADPSNGMVTIKEKVPSHIQQKVEERIKREVRKKPDLKEEDFNNWENKLQFLDLMEYFQVIVNKNNWDKFEDLFRQKESLSLKFQQLSGIRNAIRHSRELDEVTRMEGEAAIIWFNKILLQL